MKVEKGFEMLIGNAGGIDLEFEFNTLRSETSGATVRWSARDSRKVIRTAPIGRITKENMVSLGENFFTAAKEMVKKDDGH